MNKPNKLLFIGNHTVDFSTEAHYAKEYEKLGCEVIRAQENETTTDELLELSKDVQLVHYVHTHSWITPGSISIEQYLEELRKQDIVSIGVHLDKWVGLQREVDVLSHPWWKTDYTFTADGGADAFYKSKGVNHRYLKAGVYSDECYFGSYDNQFACNVAFIGSYGYHPEYSYRPELIDWLTETYGDQFRRYAGDVQPWGTIRGHALNRLYASAKVTIGDTLNIGFKHGHYYSDRLYEAIGRGGFIIFPYIEGIEESFELGTELVTYEYGNFEQLKSLIDYYLDHEEERDKIRTAGFMRVKKDHTYANRVEEIFSILEKDGRI